MEKERPSGRKVTTTTLAAMKSRGEKICALTAYDCPTARLLDEAGMDILLVGDSVGMTRLGYENTLPVTLEEMLHHVKAVKRGTRRALLVADMPFMTYQLESLDAVRNAARLVKEGGAEAVKLEGGREIGMKVKAILEAGIPVMGHLGMTPQSVHRFGGYAVQGKDPADEERLITDAKILEGAGTFAVVLECLPVGLAKEISGRLRVPTIGIGAGPYCDGQVLVSDDLLGLTEGHQPKFVKRYARLADEVRRAAAAFREDVTAGRYPADKYSYV